MLSVSLNKHFLPSFLPSFHRENLCVSDSEAQDGVPAKFLEHPRHCHHHHLPGVHRLRRLPVARRQGENALTPRTPRRVCRLRAPRVLGDQIRQCYRYRRLPCLDQGLVFYRELLRSTVLQIQLYKQQNKTKKKQTHQ